MTITTQTSWALFACALVASGCGDTKTVYVYRDAAVVAADGTGASGGPGGGGGGVSGDDAGPPMDGGTDGGTDVGTDVGPPAGAPEITTLVASYNPDRSSLGFEFTATSEDEITVVRLALFDGGGERLPALQGRYFEFPIDDARFLAAEVTETGASGRFSVQLPGGTPEAAEASVWAVDVTGREGAAAMAAVGTPDSRDRGEDCDPRGALSTCEMGDGCIEVAGAWTCAAVSPPTLATAALFANAARGTLAVRVTGSDAEGDVVAVRVLLEDAVGEPLVVDDGTGPQPLGSLVAAIQPEWSGDDYAAELSAALAGVNLSSLATGRIVVLDSTQLESPELVVALSQSAAVQTGEPCDRLAALDRCTLPDLCTSLEGSAASCQQPPMACPAAVVPVPLHDHPVLGGYAVAGSNADAVNLIGEPSCGGGGPQSAFAFIAPEPASFRFAVLPKDPLADTVLVARSHCAYDHPSLELGCNDDVAPRVHDRTSALELTLAQDQVVYLFVDGRAGTALGLGGFAGEFVLSVEKL